MTRNWVLSLYSHARDLQITLSASSITLTTSDSFLRKCFWHQILEQLPCRSGEPIFSPFFSAKGVVKFGVTCSSCYVFQGLGVRIPQFHQNVWPQKLCENGNIQANVTLLGRGADNSKDEACHRSSTQMIATLQNMSTSISHSQIHSTYLDMVRSCVDVTMSSTLREAQMFTKSFVHEIAVPRPPEKCQFSGFCTDFVQLFLIVGPFQGGGEPNFPDKNLMDIWAYFLQVSVPEQVLRIRPTWAVPTVNTWAKANFRTQTTLRGRHPITRSVFNRVHMRNEDDRRPNSFKVACMRPHFLPMF